MTWRGNLSDELILKNEAELTYYWVRLTGNLSDPQEMQTFRISCFATEEWKNMLKGCAKVGKDWWNVAGWKKWEMLHDPRLLKDEADRKKLEIK